MIFYNSVLDIPDKGVHYLVDIVTGIIMGRFEDGKLKANSDIDSKQSEIETLDLAA